MRPIPSPAAKARPQRPADADLRTYMDSIHKELHAIRIGLVVVGAMVGTLLLAVILSGSN